MSRLGRDSRLVYVIKPSVKHRSADPSKRGQFTGRTKVVPRYLRPLHPSDAKGVFCAPAAHVLSYEIKSSQEGEKMSKELAKTYDPKGIEERLYKKWEIMAISTQKWTAAKSRLRL